MLSALSFNRQQMPALFEGSDIAERCALRGSQRMGNAGEVPVVAGGDNARLARSAARNDRCRTDDALTRNIGRLFLPSAAAFWK